MMKDKLKPLSPYFKPYATQLVVGLGCVAGAVTLGLAAPVIIGRAIDTFRQSVSSSALLRYAGLLVAITAVQGIFSFLQRRILVTLSRDIEFDLRNNFFAHLQRLSQSFFQDHHTGDLMARGTNDLQAVRMLCGPAIMYSANTLLMAIGALILMARIDVGLTLLALCTLPLVAGVTKVFGQRIHTLFQTVQEQFAAISTQVQESLAGIQVIRAYAEIFRQGCNVRTYDRMSIGAIRRQWEHQPAAAELKIVGKAARIPSKHRTDPCTIR